MGLEAVKDEIIANAKRQEVSLLTEASQKAAEIIKDAEIEIQSFREKSEAESKRIIETIKKQELASAELESKKMLLEAKRQLINQVFAGVQKKIEALGDKKKEVYMDKLLEMAKNDIEVAKVYCNKKDAKLVKGFEAESADIIGGIIAENKDGTVRVVYSFDTLLQAIKENELQKINQILFG